MYLREDIRRKDRKVKTRRNDWYALLAGYSCDLLLFSLFLSGDAYNSGLLALMCWTED